MTIGDFIRQVLAIDTEDQARTFFAEHVAALRAMTPPCSEPEAVARANVGWCFGEGMSSERRAMWRAACGASHPGLGDIVEDPTPGEVFEAGMRKGSRR